MAIIRNALPTRLQDTDDSLFLAASRLFKLLSAPMRLRILKCLCEGEKNVSELLNQVPTTQPNMSQHLNALYEAGVLGRRREGVHIFYQVADARITELCRVVCAEMGKPAPERK